MKRAIAGRLPSGLLSLRVCWLTEHAVETAAVAGIDQRDRAVAARFEHEQAGWSSLDRLHPR